MNAQRNSHDVTGQVIRIISKTQLIINIGKSSGINNGDQISVLGITEDIFDIDNVQKLGSLTFVKDILEVIDVQENYSVLAKIDRYSTDPFDLNYDYTDDEPVPYLDLPIDEKDITPLKNNEDKTIKLGDQIRLLNWHKENNSVL